MIRKTGFAVLWLCGALLAPICAANADPIMNVSDHPVTNLKKLSLADVRRGIVLGGTRYKWTFEDLGPGQLKASQFEGKLQAVISITFTPNSYSIMLQQSSGLGQKGDQIRSRYNRWITLLTRNIDAELTKIAAGTA